MSLKVYKPTAKGIKKGIDSDERSVFFGTKGKTRLVFNKTNSGYEFVVFGDAFEIRCNKGPDCYWTLESTIKSISDIANHKNVIIPSREKEFIEIWKNHGGKS